MTETWLPVPGHPDYQVSDLGRILSLKWGKRRLRRLHPNSSGYLSFHLSEGPLSKSARVHVLVAAAFLGPRPPGLVVRHLDGDKRNNRLSNLVYGTPSENCRDTIAHGRNYYLSRTHCVNGHAYDEQNTLYTINGRRCRACSREVTRAIRARRKAAQVAS